MFLTLEDFRRSIRERHLLAIIDNELPLLDAAIDDAVAEMQPYLRPVYDVASIFAAEGENRDRFLVNIAMDIAIWKLLSRVQPNQIPQLRQDQFDLAMERLDKISKGQLPLGLPRAPRESGDARSLGRAQRYFPGSPNSY